MIKLYCNEKYLKKGGRKAVKMSLENFKQKINDKFNDGETIFEVSLLENVGIRKDVFKIEFSDENITSVPGEFHDNGGDLVGYHEINGLPFFGVLAGGDWEYPLFFIVYYDGKKFRGYVPTAGNVFHKDQKTAIGSEFYPENAKEEYQKFLRKYSDITENELKKVGEHRLTMDILFDWEWIKKDIQARIIVGEECSKKEPVEKKEKKAKEEKAKKEIKKEKIRKKFLINECPDLSGYKKEDYEEYYRDLP